MHVVLCKLYWFYVCVVFFLFLGFLSLNVFFMCPLWAHNWLNKLSIYLILYPELYSVERNTGARGTDLPPPFFLTFCLQIYFQ
jgi:hypothetical protein